MDPIYVCIARFGDGQMILLHRVRCFVVQFSRITTLVTDGLAQLYLTVCCLWVPVTTAWRVLRLRMEKRPPIWRVPANKSNKQSRTADKGWSSSLGVGRGANNSSP